MRILVTGGTGFAGTHLTGALREAGHEVACYSLRSGDDVRDYDRLRSSVARLEPDQVYHLAAVAWPRESLTDPRRVMDVNTTGTLNVLEAVRHTGSHARVLVTGTSEEYGYEGHEVLTEDSQCRPQTPYGVSKLAATTLAMTYVQRYGMPVVVTRAFNHTGWGRQSCNAESAFARRIVAVERGEADHVAHGDLSSYRNYTSVHDVIRAYRQAIMLEPGIYNVCSSETVSMGTVMNVLKAQAKVSPITLKRDPHLGSGSHGGGFPHPSAFKLSQACGWEPSVSLETALGEVLDYWRSR